MAALKEVLVSIGENNREVQFSGSRDQLLAAIEISFVDILGNGGLRDSAHIQMWKQKWGCFVDLKLGQEIPDGCQLKVINVVKQTVSLDLSTVLDLATCTMACILRITACQFPIRLCIEIKKSETQLIKSHESVSLYMHI